MKGMEIFPDTKDKFAEAKYFLDRMIQENDNEAPFRFNTSAFVTAAVSVEELLSTEANDNSNIELNSWRNEQVRIYKEDPNTKIVYEQRRKTTHHKLLRTDTEATTYITVLNLELEVQPRTVSMGIGGKILVSPISVDSATAFVLGETKPTYPIETTRSELTHYFKGCRDRDVISICEECLHKLEALINLCEVKYKRY